MRRRSGYSLLEVLVAFAIATMVIAALIPGQAALLERTKEGQESLLAYDFALSRLAELSVVRPLHEEINKSNYDRWLVRISVISVDRLDIENNQFAIVVLISDPNGHELARAESLVVMP